MEEIEIPRFSIFFGHRYLQHGGTSRCGKHSLRYHSSFILESCKLNDTVAFAYGAQVSKHMRPSQENRPREPEKKQMAIRKQKLERWMNEHPLIPSFTFCTFKLEIAFWVWRMYMSILSILSKYFYEMYLLPCFVVDSTSLEKRRTTLYTKLWRLKIRHKQKFSSDPRSVLAYLCIPELVLSSPALLLWKAHRRKLQIIQA